MSTNNRLNSLFLNSYIELDKICSQKFGLASGGVTEYINRLVNSRFAPERDEVLPRLVKYRNIRNRIAHEEGALGQSNDITKLDLRWLDTFKHNLEKKRDPISVYPRKARKYAKRRRAKRIVIVLLTLVVAAASAGVYYMFSNGLLP
jgi:hypothetical protein